MKQRFLRPWQNKEKLPLVDVSKMEGRERSDELYHSRRWTKLSKAFRSEHPLCVECERKGIITPSEVTDHIIPIGYHDFWDQANWQALCRKCNIIKGNRDKKRYRQGGGGANL